VKSSLLPHPHTNQPNIISPNSPNTLRPQTTPVASTSINTQLSPQAQQNFQQQANFEFLRQQQQSQPPQQFTIPDRFGLLGLLSVIRMTDPDLNTLALGTDLTTLGLNLNSPECLYNTFASPFTDTPAHREPDYVLPSCYYVQPPMQPPTSKMNLFSDETLFYLFYSMPNDLLQNAAAAELYHRDWRYHKELKIWLTRVPNNEPLSTTPTHERGSYIYFDANTWDRIRKDNFTLVYELLEERK